MEIDEFVLENVFHKFTDTNNMPVYYRETNDCDGWIVLWTDGYHIHTYRYPPDVWGGRNEMSDTG